MPLDIDDANKQISKLDRLLTSIENLWKKHWKLLTIIILVSSSYFFIRWAMSLPPVDTSTPNIEQQDTIQQTDSSQTNNY